MIFSKRLEIAKEAERWRQDHNVAMVPLGIVTALDVLGYLKLPAREQRDQADAGLPELDICPTCGTALGIKE